MDEFSKIKWNPFIPYWIGVSSSDSLAIFDLRYNGNGSQQRFSTSHLNDVLFSTIHY